MKLPLLITLLAIPLISYGQNDSIGIYYKHGEEIHKIQPLIHSNKKAANARDNRVYNNDVSSNIVSSSPTFIFYYPKQLDKTNIREYNTYYITKPTDVILVPLRQKKRKRELATAKVRPLFYGTTYKDEVKEYSTELLVKELREGVYQVSFTNKLNDGEYAFVFKEIDGAGIGGFIFDFSVGGKNIKEEKYKKMKDNNSDMYF